MGALWLVARHEAELSFPRILLLSVGITVLSLLLSLAIGAFALPLIIAATAYGLVRFCYVTWTQAWIVTGIYLATQIGLSLLLPSS